MAVKKTLVVNVDKYELEKPVEDPAVEAALGKPRSQSFYARLARVKEMTPAQRRKAQKDRQRTKETYDLPKWLIETIEEIAHFHGVPKSNVAAHLIAAGLRSLLDGEINLNWIRKASRSPRYEGILEPPEAVDLAKLERYFNGR